MKFGEGPVREGDIEDRRGAPGGRARVKLSLGMIVLLGVLSLVFKKNFFTLVPAGSAPMKHVPTAEDEQLKQFLSRVTTDLQDTWSRELPRQTGVTYPRSTVVLFEGSTPTACGLGESATGPFYCPGDRKVYLDLSFFQELHRRFGAPGDAAQAYVLAHEIGHHVQTVLGAEGKLRAEQRASPERKNELSVRFELQADCYAGIWARSTKERKILEPGDLEEALRCAQAIGDDTLQKQATGRVRPERFTHGTAQQRARWFQRGFASGQIKDCDTSGALDGAP